MNALVQKTLLETKKRVLSQNAAVGAVAGTAIALVVAEVLNYRAARVAKEAVKVTKAAVKA